jgi:hypothetical protein
MKSFMTLAADHDGEKVHRGPTEETPASSVGRTQPGNNAQILVFHKENRLGWREVADEHPNCKIQQLEKVYSAGPKKDLRRFFFINLPKGSGASITKPWSLLISTTGK